MAGEKIEIAGLKIDNVTYQDLIDIIEDSVGNMNKKLISYANANTINLSCRNPRLKDLLNSFDIIHPDGAGIYRASRFLYGKDGFRQWITGSDFYPMLADEAIKKNWSIYFFGHDEGTLNKISCQYPVLNIAGVQEGFNFDDDNVINDINRTNPDILIIGLSFPKQEEWLFKYKELLNFKAALCVGDGIKVFAGSKSRGPVFLRKLGLEWMTRLTLNPVKYFSRYVIGNPLFLYRIITIKIRKFKR